MYLYLGKRVDLARVVRPREPVPEYSLLEGIQAYAASQDAHLPR